MDFYPFVKCLHPLRIRNKYTDELMLVGCGKCATCRSRRASILTQKCDLESLSHRFTYFITLTYSSEYLPLAKIHFNSDTSSFDIYSQDEEISFPNGIVRRYHEVLHSYIACEPDEIKVLDLLIEKFNLNGYIPYLCKDDLQKFFKRLRKRTDKYEEKIRYFACGELGPLHFRPHYHILLWFENEDLAENLRQIIREAWPFGRVDVQKSAGQCSSYVAKYVNSLGSVPKLYQSSRLQPFSVHSQFLGEEILELPKDKVYELTPCEFIKRSIPLHGVYTDVFLWRSLTSLYYPKCKGFFEKSDNECLYSYSIYDVAREWTQEVGAYKQATKIVEHITEYGWTSPIDKEQKLLDYLWNSLDLESKCYEGDKIDYGDWYEYFAVFDLSKLIQQIYRELFISKRFLYFCCDGNPNLHRKMIERIKNFYSDCKYDTLTALYSSIEESFENGFMSESDVDFIYADTFVSDMFENVHYYKAFRSFTDYIQRISMKHKEQNDANKIFCY